MEQKHIEERKRKFLIALPIIALPFIVLLFYSLGGGKGKAKPDKLQPSALSTTLPDPVFDDSKPMDKMSLYQQAEEDSLEKQRQAEHDPFGQWMPPGDTPSTNAEKMFPPADRSPYSYPVTTPMNQPFPKNKATIKKAPEEKVENKIAELEKLLKSHDTSAINLSSSEKSLSDSDAELERLETMMKELSGQQNTKSDPELSQMDGMLEKILDIQYPDRVKDKLREKSEQNKGIVYAVSGDSEEGDAHLLSTSNRKSAKIFSINNLLTKGNGFYGDDDNANTPTQNAIAAVVHESQLLVSGSTIKIRLEQNAYLQGQMIPKGSFVFGNCSLNGERLQVSINSIRSGNSIFPVSLIAYDMDGLPGIRIPGSINRDAAKKGTDQAIQTLNMASMDPSIGAQATAAGIEAAKNLLSKKVKLIKVTVKAGYSLLLASEH